MSAGAGSVDRKGSLRAGIAVERWSIAWMAVEAAAALTAALQAGSVVLGAFGADSLIELAAALVLLRRLQAERRGQDAEGLERRAGRIVGALLLALAALVVAAAGRDLILRTQPGATALGLAIAAASTAIMPWIVATKRRVATAIGSRALRADAACGITCAYMAGTALAGLGLRAAFGWWWADPVAALGLVYFLVREGREAITGEHCCDTCRPGIACRCAPTCEPTCHCGCACCAV